MIPKEHDVVIIRKRLRGVVVEVKGGKSLVYATLCKDSAKVSQQWYPNEKLKVIRRWRSLLDGSEPDDIKIIER